MLTSNAIYGSGLAPLAAPALAPDAVPTIVPHYTQTTYPYAPRAKTQIFGTTVLPSGQRLVFEKAGPVVAAAAAAEAAIDGGASATVRSLAFYVAGAQQPPTRPHL